MGKGFAVIDAIMSSAQVTNNEYCVADSTTFKVHRQGGAQKTIQTE